MSVRIGINGFGRMGRLALRAAWGWPEFEIVHINEIRGGSEAAAHLLEFDSVHGRWDCAARADGPNGLRIGSKRLGFTDVPDPADVRWRDIGCDIVIECTGRFKTAPALQPVLDSGVRKIIVAAPVREGALNVVYGINDHLYEPDRHHLLTAASCTTNCLAPVVKVIHDNLGIQRGSITTLHDVTNTQVMVDAPHSDLRRARSALTSLIPTTTGSATAITLIYPELKGKLNGHAIRVPLLNASLTDCVFEINRPSSREEINDLFRAAANGPLRGVLGFEDRPLVSVDFVNDPRSAIIDGPSTLVVDGTHVKIYAWYDNEWGYVNRMMELCRKVAGSM